MKIKIQKGNGEENGLKYNKNNLIKLLLKKKVKKKKIYR